MFRWFKSRRSEQPVSSFGRYVTSRKSWIADAKDYDCIVPMSVATTSDPPSTIIPIPAVERDIYDNPEDHIYEEIDDKVPASTFGNYIDAIMSLACKLEEDFGECPVITSKHSENTLDGVASINLVGNGHEDRKIHDVLCEQKADVVQNEDNTTEEIQYIHTALCSREKCYQWVCDQAAILISGSMMPIPMSPAMSSSEEFLPIKACRKQKRSKTINVRKMSSEKRRLLLKKIEATWFESSDDSSDDSILSEAPSNEFMYSQNYTIVTCSEVRSLLSSGAETSGFYEDISEINSTSHKTSIKSVLSHDSVISSSLSGSSDDLQGPLTFFNPTIGFGLNRWYSSSLSKSVTLGNDW